MSSDGQPLLRILTRWPTREADGPTVLCPCFEGLSPEVAFTVGILPVHDANGQLLEELDRAEGPEVPDFAGVFLADPFRRLDDILDRVEAAGIRGVVNLPTVVPFLRHGTNRIFAALHKTEQSAIDHAADRGFDCRLVTSAATDNPREITLEHFTFPDASLPG